ncbi:MULTISPECIES: branched-chain amino acid aminotransferase [Paenibacillus]|uniref:branched-chain amino acid aminotransferase n=1 Tax=Paenibacillus TaxID=44249 RepID=UPI0022B8DFA2|nr:branched-chain amino acid aminotransferase [Paenibacillus caseinilyticus]MCZ8523926.1 branched-chain amino acid aminotransferase [Paenibacillus caseinilyticus]
MTYTIKIERSTAPKAKPQEDQLGFGKHFTDHMFVVDYETGKGWHSPRIVPYQGITLDPAAKVFHYGQTVFEGMKAYRAEGERLLLFRPQDNFERLNLSNDRMHIPQIDGQLALEGLEELIRVDHDWIPSAPGTSLYIRPFVIATEASLGVAPSAKYQFIIIMSPVGAYYAEGINPVKIYVESGYVRAVKGGVGTAKTAGNYAAGLKAQEEAAKRGCAQVLWLDGVHRKYVEEVGSMNVFFHIDGKVVTPALSGSILDGITRRSAIALLREWNVPVEERALSIDELFEASRSGKLTEAFGTGTAAVISPIGGLYSADGDIVIGGGKTGELASKLYDTLTGIQLGKVADPFGWTSELQLVPAK